MPFGYDIGYGSDPTLLSTAGAACKGTPYVKYSLSIIQNPTILTTGLDPNDPDPGEPAYMDYEFARYYRAGNRIDFTFRVRCGPYLNPDAGFAGSGVWGTVDPASLFFLRLNMPSPTIPWMFTSVAFCLPSSPAVANPGFAEVKGILLRNDADPANSCYAVFSYLNQLMLVRDVNATPSDYWFNGTGSFYVT